MEDKTYSLYFHHENYDHSDAGEKKSERELSGSLEKLVSVPLPYRLTAWRWVALFLMNLVLIGYFFVFDSPQPLETAIKATLQINDQHYSYLYSFLAVPNIILPLIAGYIVDVVGVRPSMAIFGTLVLIGQLILAYGAHILSFNMMIAGRIIYSFGADPLNIAQMVMVNRWFKGKEVALALSLATFMAGAGKAFCSAVMPLVYEATGDLATPFIFGGFLCLFSLICVFVMVVWDFANEKREVALDPTYFSHLENTEKVNLSDIKKFKLIVWLLVLNFGLSDGVIFTLRSFMNDFYHSIYGYSTVKAGSYISVHYIAMALASPLMGKFIDKKGLRASIMFFSCLLGVFGFLFYVLVPTCDECSSPIIPLILFGLFMGFDDAAVFASLPLVLEEKYLGTGYGFYYVVENLLLTVLPPIAGIIKISYPSDTIGYYWMSIFLLGLAGLVLVEALILLIVDFRGGRVLDRTVFPDHEKLIHPQDHLNQRPKDNVLLLATAL